MKYFLYFLSPFIENTFCNWTEIWQDFSFNFLWSKILLGVNNFLQQENKEKKICWLPYEENRRNCWHFVCHVRCSNNVLYKNLADSYFYFSISWFSIYHWGRALNFTFFWVKVLYSMKNEYLRRTDTDISWRQLYIGDYLKTVTPIGIGDNLDNKHKLDRRQPASKKWSSSDWLKKIPTDRKVGDLRDSCCNWSCVKGCFKKNASWGHVWFFNL